MPLWSRSASPAVLVELRWGDALLATEITRAPARLATVFARAAVSVPGHFQDLVVRREAAGDLLLGSDVRGWVRGWSGEARVTAGLLTVTARTVTVERPPRPRLRPGVLALVVVLSAVAHVGAAISLLRRAGDGRVDADTQIEHLRAFLRRLPEPPRPELPPRPAPPEHGTPAPRGDEFSQERGAPWEPVHVRAAHVALPVDPTVTPFRNRGAVVDLWSPRARRAVETSALVFNTMGREAPPPPPDSDRVEPYRGLGPVGTGFGRGCSHPGDCQTVAVGALQLGTRRDRAAHAAARALDQRPSAPPDLRPPDPELGEITMEYAQRLIRHDVLADVVRCYTQRAEQTALPSGRVVVRFAIHPDGRVTDASIVSSAVHDEPTHACITQRLRRYTFPASAQSTDVTYPFTFSSLAPEP